MNTLFKQTLTASILSTMIAGTAFAAPSEAPSRRPLADAVAVACPDLVRRPLQYYCQIYTHAALC